jgi:RsiW-degrading membrane proteinase PrsW (M82 family)
MSDMKFTCPHCEQHLEGDPALMGQQVQCPSCTKSFTATPPVAPAQQSQEPVVASVDANDVQKIASKLSGHLTSFAGVEKLEGFSLKDLFSEVFRKHSREEIEEYFTVGTPSTTPSIETIDTTWPKPWVFSKTFIGALVVYILFLSAWNEFGNVNLIPGLIMVGSFAVPIATLIFFVEMNARRNVSLYQVIRLLFMGGILSLILSLLLFQLTASMQLEWLGASVAGLAEEPGKLLALLTVTGVPKYRYKLNGLLFGAAVGTGFAAFESAGYALWVGLHDTDMMKDTIMVRGMLSPFAHIAWTAMCGAALWRVKGSGKFSLSMLKDVRFLKVFAVAVVLHMLWNSPLHLPFYGKYAILGVAAWIIILGLIQEGLKELRQEKSGSQEVPTTPRTVQ